MLSRRCFFLSAGGALARPAVPAPANVVLVLFDDLGWRDFGCYGHPVHQTPHADGLARQGMQFLHASAAAPVCSPTRAAIQTGKYPARLQLTDWIPGVPVRDTDRLARPEFRQQLPAQETTLAERLRGAGYRTASIGKWHLGGAGSLPQDHGYERNVGGDHRGQPYSYFGPFREPGLEGAGPDDYIADRLTSEAVRFLEQVRKERFFLYLPHFSVHTPLQARKERIEHYRSRGALNPIYAAMVDHADQALGVLLASLDRFGLSENTLLIVTSDNGGLRYAGRRNEVTSNAPLRAGKGHLYEGGVRVPLIVRWPGRIHPGARNEDPVNSIDLLPTILEACGLPALPGADGRSLVRALGGRRMPERPLFWHYPHYHGAGGMPSSAIRVGRFKLIEFLEDRRVELYDLEADPGETTNLAKRQRGRAERMRRQLEAWRREVGAAMPTPNPGYNPAVPVPENAGAEPPTPPA